MLTIDIKQTEYFDEGKQEFIAVKGQTVVLEHSLVSLSKWESKWCKPFLTDKPKSFEESLYYIECMTLTQNVKPETFLVLATSNMDVVTSYIQAPMTATTFSNNSNRITKREVITSELIYYWMIALNIPFECQKWNLNRLLTLINVCNIKNQPPAKMSKAQTLKKQAALNAARKNALNTRG